MIRKLFIAILLLPFIGAVAGAQTLPPIWSGLASPANTVTADLTGDGEVGSTLTCTTGTWTGGVLQYAYHWQRDDDEFLVTSANTYVTQAEDDDSTITCSVYARNAAGEVSALADGQILVGEAAPFTPDFEEGFEGTPPTGYHVSWSFLDAPGTNGCITTNAGGVPSGGGTYALQQWWETAEGAMGYTQTDTLQRPLIATEGQTFEVCCDLKYHASFNANSAFIKSIIFQSGDGAANEIYFDSHTDSNRVEISFQELNTPTRYGSNVGGDDYPMPHGSWVNFRIRIKVACDENGGPADGYVKIWVNDTLRWERTGIYTCHDSGGITDLILSSVFGVPETVVHGANQKRWFDNFTTAVVTE